MKKLFCCVLAVTLCLSVLCTAGISAHAATITLYKNSTVKCTILENSALELLFVPAADGAYTFFSSNNSDDPEAVLYKIEGEEYTEICTDGDSGGEHNFKFTVLLNANEKYVLSICDYWGASSTCDVKVTDAEKEYDGIDATVLTLDTEEALNADMGYTYFEFTPTADGLYNFYSVGSGIDDAYVHCYYVYDGALIVESHADDSLLTWDFSLIRELKAGTTYVFKVACYSQPETETASYTVAISQNYTPAEADNAIAITLGSFDFDPDTCYVFIPSQNGSYTFSTDTNSYISIYKRISAGLVPVADAASPLTVDLEENAEYIFAISANSSGFLSLQSGLAVTSSFTFDEENMLITGIPEKMTADNFANEFSGAISVKTADGTVIFGNTLVCTGNRVTVNGKEYVAVISGDVDGNGQVNSTDFMRVRRHFLELYVVEGESYLAGDVNGDGRLNSVDFMRIRSHYLGRYDLYA